MPYARKREERAVRSFALCRCEEIPELNSTDVRHGARHPMNEAKSQELENK